jgi:acetyl-CoA synthetase
MPNAKAFVEARDFLLNAHSYEEAKAGFQWPRLKSFNWALDYFDTLPERCSHPALMYVDDTGVETEISFQTLKERSNKVANFLQGLGLRKGNRVLLIMPSCVELFEVFLGAMKLGCVLIPASTLLTEEDVQDRVTRGRVSSIISSLELTRKVESTKTGKAVSKVCIGGKPEGWIDYADVDEASNGFTNSQIFLPSDELLIYFTSGTTAKPKLVLHTHGSYPVGHLTTMYWINVKPGEAHYNISAPGWAKYAWSSIFGVWNAEATSFLFNYAGRFDAKKVLDNVERYQVTTLCAPPTVWRHLLLEDLKTHQFSLKQLVSAGEPLIPEIIQRVKSATGLVIREGFGQSETALLIGVFPDTEVKPGSMGVEAPGFQIAILDGQQQVASAKTDGAVAIRVKPQRPVGLMDGYIDPPEKNAEVFVGDWYLTGDLAYRDAEGYFWFIGRSDDVFKSSDYRISAFELESELMVQPSIAEVAVVASPDHMRGFVPKAYIALKPDVQPTRELALEIFKFTRQHIASYKRPRIIQFMKELPKTVSGKIKRTELRRSEADLRDSNARTSEEYFENDFIFALVDQRNSPNPQKN